MKPPILINDSKERLMPGDITVYKSVSDAVRNLEYPDADDPGIHILDRDGSVLSLVAGPNQKLSLELRRGETVSEAELLELLLKYLRAVHPNLEYEQARYSIDELFNILFDFQENH